MANIQGFPKNFGYFTYQNKKIVTQTLLRPSFRKLFQFCEQKFILRTISLIFIEALKRLKSLDRFGFIHNDINMQNLTWGSFFSGKLKEKISLI